jgi:hypothetical protein
MASDHPSDVDLSLGTPGDCLIPISQRRDVEHPMFVLGTQYGRNETRRELLVCI